MLKNINFESSFYDKYVDNIGYCLFEASYPIPEKIFIPMLNVFNFILKTKKPIIKDNLIEIISNFLNINYKNMKNYELILFVELICLI